MSALYRDLFYDQTFNSIFDTEQQVSALLSFEKELAVAQAGLGMIPAEAAQAIENICQPGLMDMERLTQDSSSSGNVLIPLIKQCTELLQQQDSGAYNFIHFGATSQDAIDTASMIQYKKAGFWIGSKLKQLILDLFTLAETHIRTPMVGRTFLQQAKPLTFGFKIAGWIDGLLQAHQEISTLDYPLQLGGAVGTWSGYEGSSYEQLSGTLAQNLQLTRPLKPWHSQRQVVAQIATTLGILQGHVSKISNDLMLMAQTEVGEVSFDAAEKGHSSSMPHKNNPVNAILILANGIRVPPLVSVLLEAMDTDQERSAGAWHAEWETMESLYKLSAGSLRLSGEMIRELVVHTDRMSQNIHLTKGLIFAEIAGKALAGKLGKIVALDLVEKSCTESRSTGISLQTILAGKPEVMEHFSIAALDDLFKIENNLGLAEYFTTQVLKKVKDVFAG